MSAGEVSAKTADSITVKHRDGSTTVIHVTAKTTYEKKGKDPRPWPTSRSATGSRPKGLLRADGSMDAVEVEARAKRVPKTPKPKAPGDQRRPRLNRERSTLRRMVWDDTVETPIGRDEPVELVGTNLRLTGSVSLGRFGRLSDLINASSRLHPDPGRATPPAERRPDEPGPARTDGRPGRDLVHRPAAGARPRSRAPRSASSSRSSARTSKPARPASSSCSRRATRSRARSTSSARRTSPASSMRPIRGSSPVTDVTTRSLADRRIVSRYDFILINRTQMIAAAEVFARGDGASGPWRDRAARCRRDRARGRPRDLGASLRRTYKSLGRRSKVLPRHSPFERSLRCTPSTAPCAA